MLRRGWRSESTCRWRVQPVVLRRMREKKERLLRVEVVVVTPLFYHCRGSAGRSPGGRGK